MNEIWLLIAAGILALWGTAHLVKTRAVVAGFHPIGTDNLRVLTMEWINEGRRWSSSPPWSPPSP